MSEELILAEHVAVHYGRGALGVADVSVSVHKGEVVALFGPNGAGKTTTIRALTGFLGSENARVTSGRVMIKGRDVTNAPPHRISGLGIAVVPERRKVFPTLSVMENLRAVGGLPRGRAAVVAIDRMFELFPPLAERRHQQAGKMSGGEQQMLALARALIRQPIALLIDEMTLGLHASLRPMLFDVVRQVAAEETAVLLVDESTEFALALANRCYILGSGRILDEGAKERFAGSDLIAASYVN